MIVLEKLWEEDIRRPRRKTPKGEVGPLELAGRSDSRPGPARGALEREGGGGVNSIIIIVAGLAYLVLFAAVVGVRIRRGQ